MQEKLKLYEEKDKRSEFVDHILKDDETCNHYTGIRTVASLKEIFTYCDPSDMSQNMLCQIIFTLKVHLRVEVEKELSNNLKVIWLH